MNRHTLPTAALASALLLASSLTLAQQKTLKLASVTELKVLDPTFTSATITRNFGYMVYDMPFGLDANGQPQPQMVDKYAMSKDGKLWTFSLRRDLKFSDGTPVRAADVVASMQRWAFRDNLGRAMVSTAGAEWKAVDDKTFTLTLTEPFSQVLHAMAKPSSYPPVVMPERLAKMPTTAPLTEVVGSGPYLFKRDEWAPGIKAVFVRNPNYVGRAEPPSGAAGNKTSKLDRVEWLYMTDPNTALAALRKGEIDAIDQVPADFVNGLRSEANAKLVPSDTSQPMLIINHLHPPLNNPKVRQAVLKALDQDKIISAVGVPKDMRVTPCATFFVCGSPNATFAGSEPWRTPDQAKAKEMLAASGYRGEKVVMLVPSNIPAFATMAQMVGQAMKGIGMNVEFQTAEWGALVARRNKKEAPEAGGWSAFVTHIGSSDSDSPITNFQLSVPCGSPAVGAPCDKTLDELRAAWLKETNPAKRRQLLDQFQTRAYETVPYIVLGQYTSNKLFRREVKGTEKLWGGLPVVWVLDK